MSVLPPASPSSTAQSPTTAVPVLFSIPQVSDTTGAQVAKVVEATGSRRDRYWRIDSVAKGDVESKPAVEHSERVGEDYLHPHCADLIVSLSHWSLRLDQREADLDRRELELNRRTRFLRQTPRPAEV